MQDAEPYTDRTETRVTHRRGGMYTSNVVEYVHTSVVECGWWWWRVHTPIVVECAHRVWRNAVVECAHPNRGGVCTSSVVECGGGVSTPNRGRVCTSSVVE